MTREGIELKEKDWSLSFEDPYYEKNFEEIFGESIDAVQRTKAGRYVNLITPGVHGDPRNGFIPQLLSRLKQADLAVREVRYIDECGCGGFVTRVFR